MYEADSALKHLFHPKSLWFGGEGDWAYRHERLREQVRFPDPPEVGSAHKEVMYHGRLARGCLTNAGR